MKKIAVITSTRAEYGLLSPLINRIDSDDGFILDLIVTGAHLCNKQGYTIDEIIRDGFKISHRIPILEEDNTPYGITCTMANAMRGFAQCFRDDRPDMIVILGDRTEMLGVASAAMNERIPIAHIHGGEVTAGAVDDCIRHAITKMSYLHFTCTEEYRRRVIQLGENPNRVYNVGSLGAENIIKKKLLEYDELQKQTPELSAVSEMKYAVVTYHPTTLDEMSINEQIDELCLAMEQRQDLFFLITASNSDAGGDEANSLLKKYVEEHNNASFVYSLGMLRYLSAVKYAGIVLGNSSSGVLEAPILGTPSVNIGYRQQGRIQPNTVVGCNNNHNEVINAIDKALSLKREKTDIYGNGSASEQIIDIIKKHFKDNDIDLKKGFYDMC